MSVENYRDALRTERRALAPGAVDRAARTFPALAAEISARGQAARQEGLIPALTRDLSRFVLEGATPPPTAESFDGNPLRHLERCDRGPSVGAGHGFGFCSVAGRKHPA